MFIFTYELDAIPPYSFELTVHARVKLKTSCLNMYKIITDQKNRYSNSKSNVDPHLVVRIPILKLYVITKYKR